MIDKADLSARVEAASDEWSSEISSELLDQVFGGWEEDADADKFHEVHVENSKFSDHTTNPTDG